MRKQYNDPLVSMIEVALKNLINNNPENKISYRYLLGQCIRQYILPDTQIHVTTAASDLWNKIINGKSPLPQIKDYVYQDRIVSNNDIANIQTCKGTSKTIVYRNIGKGEKFKYNDIFIDEHTVPVSDIIESLKLLVNPTSQNIIGVLDKMHIVKMRRNENVGIKRHRSRITPKDILTETSQVIFDQIVNSGIDYPNNFV